MELCTGVSEINPSLHYSVTPLLHKMPGCLFAPVLFLLGSFPETVFTFHLKLRPAVLADNDFPLFGIVIQNNFCSAYRTFCHVAPP
jgi:hypothetical protein